MDEDTEVATPGLLPRLVLALILTGIAALVAISFMRMSLEPIHEGEEAPDVHPTGQCTVCHVVLPVEAGETSSAER